jgi:hypothetical protein
MDNITLLYLLSNKDVIIEQFTLKNIIYAVI